MVLSTLLTLSGEELLHRTARGLFSAHVLLNGAVMLLSQASFLGKNIVYAAMASFPRCRGLLKMTVMIICMLLARISFLRKEVLHRRLVGFPRSFLVGKVCTYRSLVSVAGLALVVEELIGRLAMLLVL
jgi:hypothetical protein